MVDEILTFALLIAIATVALIYAVSYIEWRAREKARKSREAEYTPKIREIVYPD